MADAAHARSHEGSGASFKDALLAPSDRDVLTHPPDQAPPAPMPLSQDAGSPPMTVPDAGATAPSRGQESAPGGSTQSAIDARHKFAKPESGGEGEVQAGQPSREGDAAAVPQVRRGLRDVENEAERPQHWPAQRKQQPAQRKQQLAQLEQQQQLLEVVAGEAEAAAGAGSHSQHDEARAPAPSPLPQLPLKLAAGSPARARSQQPMGDVDVNAQPARPLASTP